MLNNVDLFEECLDNLAKNVDPFARETLNKVVLPIDNKIQNELLSKNARLVELITQYNNYNIQDDTSHNKDIIDKLDECLKFSGMNFCPFSQYLMVHDVTYDMYLNKLSLEEKEYIIKCYIEDRHQMYLNRNYSNIIFQVLTDNYSHKRKSSLGVEKLKKICNNFNISRITDKDSIDNDIYFILPDAGDKKLFDLIIDKNHINFDFRKEHQGKMPDALIKINNSFLIIEHKILKESGGGQDKQVTEIINFVGHGERGVYYISFMDGILFNDLKDPRETNKLYRDKENIKNNLKQFPFNYFVNEYGFLKLLNHIIENG